MTPAKSRVKAGKGPWTSPQTAPMRSLIPLAVCTLFATALFLAFPELRADDSPTPANACASSPPSGAGQ